MRLIRGAAALFVAVVAMIGAATAVRTQPQVAAGFTPVFDGTLNGWVIENTEAGNISVRDGVLRLEAPNGWLRSEREYGDVSIRVEFRFLTPDADSGLFVRAKRETQFMRGWPNNSYQVQIRNPATASRLPPVGGLFRHGMAAGETTFDPAVVEKLNRATGEWQLLEVDVVADRLTARFNGTEVLRAANIANPSGYIGFQAETGAIEVRSVAIREGRP